MFNFNFYNPTRIFFGKDRLSEIGNNVPADATVLITFGGGSAVKSGLLDKVKANLKDRKIFEFGGIEPNLRYETLMKAIEIVRKENIDFIIAVGGGSVIDGTKFICLGAFYKSEPSNILQFGFKASESDKVVPYASVLTLPATGSEMNCGAVISFAHGKFAFRHESVYPKFSILDPVYTFTLPQIQVANGIVDTFVHTTEQYITYPVDAKIQDRIAEGILLTLIEIGKTNINEPENYVARANLVWSSTMALNGIIGAGVPQDWATHMIGHELTALFGIDHAQTLAIIYPALLEVRKDKKRAKILQYAERVWNIQTGNEDEKITLAISKTRSFFESLGIKTRLSEYGIKHESIQVIVERLKAHGFTAMSETRDLSPEISREILEKAF